MKKTMIHWKRWTSCIWGVALFALIGLASYASDDRQIDRLAKECQEGKADSCRRLADIAKYSTDAKIRIAAVKKLVDPAILADIAKNDKDEDVRIESMDNPNLTDQKVLMEIAANNDNSYRILGSAIFKITDQVFLTGIAKNHNHKERESAVEKLTDHNLLAEFAKNDESIHVRCAAAKNPFLNDQKLLATLVKKEEDKLLRYKALDNPNLTDQKLLAKIANENDVNIRWPAVEKITDQALLADIALYDKEIGIREAAVENLIDQALIAKLVKQSNERRVRIAAVEKLADKFLLAEIAKNDEDDVVRKRAIDNPNLSDQLVIEEIAKNHKDSGTRSAAVYKTTNQALLAEIAKSDRSAEVREYAVGKLSDQAVLASIARSDPTMSVRSNAIKKLTDPAVLEEIAMNDKDDFCRDEAVGNPNLSDQNVLSRFTKNDKYWGVRAAAVRKLSDPVLLSGYAKNDKEYSVRESAVMNPHLVDEALLIGLATNDESGGIREAAASRLPYDHPKRRIVFATEVEARRLTDQALLADIVLLAGDRDVRKAAIKNPNLTDPALLAKVAMNSPEGDTGSDAAEKIADQDTLLKIAKNAADPYVRINAFRNIPVQVTATTLKSIIVDKKWPLEIRLEAVSRLTKRNQYKNEEAKIIQPLVEIRQNAIAQKDKETFRRFFDILTPEAISDLRKRAPKSLVQGRLIHRKSGLPHANVAVFLAEMQNDKTCALFSNLVTKTDAKGNFQFKDVPSGLYTVAYSWEYNPENTAAFFILNPKDFNSAEFHGSFENGRLSEGTITISSTNFGVNLIFEVRDSSIVECAVFGKKIFKLDFEVN